MRTEHLRYLIEINKHHSISIAAQHLYISQTSLSITLKNIEDELGLRIFQRTHSGVRLTPEGEEALALIMEIEQRMEEIRQLGSQVHLQNRTVPVISSPTILSGLTLPLHKAFLEAVPSGNLSFFSVSGEEVGTKIIKNEGHIGLTYFSRQTLSDYRMVAAKYCIQVEALFPDRFYLLAPKDHPLAKYSSIHCKELEGLNFARLPSYNSSEGLLAHLTIFGSGNQQPDESYPADWHAGRERDEGLPDSQFRRGSPLSGKAGHPMHQGVFSGFAPAALCPGIGNLNLSIPFIFMGSAYGAWRIPPQVRHKPTAAKLRKICAGQIHFALHIKLAQEKETFHFSIHRQNHIPY